MTTTLKSKSAAEIRKALKTTPVKLTIEILPNIAFEAKGEFAVLKFESTRRVINMVTNKATGEVKDESFNVHDVTYLEGSLAYMSEGQDKTKSALMDNTRVSLKGNARLDRGFATLKGGERVLIEYLGKVDAGNGRQANDYTFDVIEG